MQEHWEPQSKSSIIISIFGFIDRSIINPSILAALSEFSLTLTKYYHHNPEMMEFYLSYWKKINAFLQFLGGKKYSEFCNLLRLYLKRDDKSVILMSDITISYYFYKNCSFCFQINY